ncbi:histidine-type phosphatase [Acerihabitans sp. TG2]|uniref:histidine-type phosphatase n=1 Tax=Acerihabitans sp. TG2 TaxID=3096008 RepID=UPI002B237719|nr:histidine-type phosphatase [Acerihabitans sp. TG2]MEA9391886.1 histidine-type phosphatase [Acerihabitans sp. TG2]
MLLAQKSLPCLLLAIGLITLAVNSQAADRYVLEKVVEVSRHGVRPPTADNRQSMQVATGREWPLWVTHDGELTGHGYAAAELKGRYEAAYYRQQGLLTTGCPKKGDVYVWASPLQRTRATAQALLDGAFPGCGVVVHFISRGLDPLFQTDKMGLAPLNPLKTRAGVLAATGGDLVQVQHRFQADVERLKAAVCPPGQACPVFAQPWRLTQQPDGRVGISGLGVLSNMAETIRLEYSENLPLAQVAFGHAANALQVSRLMPLLTARYDYTNDVPYIARRGGSVLLNQILLALDPPRGHSSRSAVALEGLPPDASWLLYVAHDTNIAYLRTLLDFTWQLGVYPRGNIPPAGSLVFERWRDTQDGERFLRLYFQAQSLDQIRNLTRLDAKQPLLKSEFNRPGCRVTAVGVLCPLAPAIKRIKRAIDPSAVTPVQYN